MKKSILLLVLLSFALIINAKDIYNKVLVEFADGSKKELFLKNNAALDKKIIKFKESDDAKEEVEFLTDELKSISSPDDPNQRVIRTKAYEKKGITELPSDKLSKNSSWLFQIYKNDAITCYIKQTTYSHGGGTTGGMYMGTSNTTKTDFYLQRPDEEHPKYAFVDVKGGIGFNNLFRKLVAMYFEDQPEFVERIRNKEFSLKNIDYMLDQYDVFIKDKNK